MSGRLAYSKHLFIKKKTAWIAKQKTCQITLLKTKKTCKKKHININYVIKL